jgi:thioester reductase-like protein
MTINEFYNGKNVLITGTTGFLGKVILEKFLRCVPSLNKIFILIRVKKEENPVDRFSKELINSPIFERLRK